MIATKRWYELTDALLRFRTGPTQNAHAELFEMEELTGWPWSANWEQISEWDDIMNRTRAEFERLVNNG